jgi:hypothetical protein
MEQARLAPRVQEHRWACFLALFCPDRGQNCSVVVAAYPLALERPLGRLLALGRLLSLVVDFGQQVQPTTAKPRDFRLVSRARRL